jgi:hypothetical protein
MLVNSAGSEIPKDYKAIPQAAQRTINRVSGPLFFDKIKKGHQVGKERVQMTRATALYF